MTLTFALMTVLAASGVADAISDEGRPEAIKVTLMTECEIGGRWIHLGDVAEIEGATESRRKELAAMTLSHAPMRGVERVITRADVVRRLKVLGVHEDISFAGSSPSVLVTVVVKTVEGGRLLKFGHDYLEARLSRDGVKVVIDDPRTPAAIIVRSDNDGDEVELRAAMATRRPVGLVPVSVEVWLGGRRQARRLLSYRVHARAVVANVSRAMFPGEILTEADLEESERDLAKVPLDAITNVDELVGLRITRPVREGAVLSRRSVAMPLMIKKGEEVMLIARVGPVEARALARAAEGGSKGQIVTVINVATKRRVRARVTGQDVVEAVTQ